jgi:transcription elongation factor Elf1
MPQGELAGKRLNLDELALRYEYLILEAMEHFFVCPHCGERISMVLDTSVKGQTYVEDCEVCCQPVEVRYTVKNDAVRHFEARAM